MNDRGKVSTSDKPLGQESQVLVDRKQSTDYRNGKDNIVSVRGNMFMLRLSQGAEQSVPDDVASKCKAI